MQLVSPSPEILSQSTPRGIRRLDAAALSRPMPRRLGRAPDPRPDCLLAARVARFAEDVRFGTPLKLKLEEIYAVSSPIQITGCFSHNLCGRPFPHRFDQRA